MDTILGITAQQHTWASLVQLLSVVSLCSLRVLVMFLMLPATADETFPGVARNGFVVVVTMFVAFGQPMAMFDALAPATLLQLCCKEAFIGLLLGYAAATIFWVAESIGVVIDNLSGYNNVQMTNPLRGDQSTPVGNTMLQLCIVLFYLLGGMVALLATVFDTYAWWPLTKLTPDTAILVDAFMLRHIDSMFQLIVKLASPILLVLVLIDLGFGFIGRVGEKLEPSSLAQPVRGTVALLLVAILTATFVEGVKEKIAFTDFSSYVGKLMPHKDKTSH